MVCILFAFFSKELCVNLDIPIKSVQVAKQEKTPNEVFNDQKLQIEAAIVRVMKTHTTLQKTQLVDKVLDELSKKFTPKVAAIKKCINRLIEKEYIERAEDQSDTYNYLSS